MSWIDRLKTKQNAPLDQCLNCQHPLTPEDNYCPNCGQKATISKIGFWSLLGTFLSSVMNLDGSLWRTLGGIFRPGYLSKKFMEGERKSYLHPMRLFFFTLVIHFALLGAISNTEQVTKFQRKIFKEYDESQLYSEYLALEDTIKVGDSICYSTIEQQLFDGVTPVEKDTFTLNLIGTHTYRLLQSDLIELPTDSLYKKYELKSVSDRIIIRQMSRVMRDLSGTAKYVIGNILWAVIVALFVIAWLMKIIYARKGRLYVEHAVVLSHIHAFAFIVASVLFGALLLVYDQESLVNQYAPIALGIIAIYSIWAFKAYYQQGIIKTLIKLGIIGVAYAIIVSLCFVLVLLISLLFI